MSRRRFVRYVQKLGVVEVGTLGAGVPSRVVKRFSASGREAQTGRFRWNASPNNLRGFPEI